MGQTDVMKPNGLALKYQGEYGRACRNIDIADFMDNALIQGKGRVFGPGFLEKLTDFGILNTASFDHDVTDATLVRKQAV